MLLQSLPEVVSGATYRVRRYSSSRSHSPLYKPSKESSATQSTCLTTPRSTFNTQESTSSVTTYRTGDHAIDTDDLQSWFNDVNEVNSLADQSNSFDRTATKPTVEEVPNTPTLQNGAISEESTLLPGAADPSEKSKEMANDFKLAVVSCANFFNPDSAVTECTSTPSGEAQVTTTPSAQTKKSMVTDMISHIHKCAEKSPSSFGKRIRGSISKMVKKREHREEKKWMNLVTGNDGSFSSPAPHSRAEKFISSPPQVSPVARAKKIGTKIHVVSSSGFANLPSRFDSSLHKIQVTYPCNKTRFVNGEALGALRSTFASIWIAQIYECFLQYSYRSTGVGVFG